MQDSIIIKRLRAFGPRSSVSHVQLERTRVGNKALVTEDLIDSTEQRFRLGWANP